MLNQSQQPGLSRMKLVEEAQSKWNIGSKPFRSVRKGKENVNAFFAFRIF